MRVVSTIILVYETICHGVIRTRVLEVTHVTAMKRKSSCLEKKNDTSMAVYTLLMI